MLGEIEILNDEHIGLWTQFDITRIQIDRLEATLWEEIPSKVGFPVDQEILADDSVNYALRFYLGYFHDKFDGEDRIHVLNLARFEKVSVKILKTLNYTTKG